MRSALLKIGALALVATVAGGLAATPAEARVFVGVGFGFPVIVPAYPPPVVYAPPAVVYTPPPVVYTPAPAAAPAAASQYWYYCDNPQGYYPYVTSCGSGWRQVSPTPAQ